MISYQKAREIAEEQIDQMNASNGAFKVALLEDYFVQTAFLWIFFYQSEKFLKTGKKSYMLGGNSPFLIAKTDGNIFQYSTSYSEEEMIELYEEENQIWQLFVIDESFKDLKKMSYLRKILCWSLHELNECKKQDNRLVNSGSYRKLLSIQQVLQENNIQAEILVSKEYEPLLQTGKSA